MGKLYEVNLKRILLILCIIVVLGTMLPDTVVMAENIAKEDTRNKINSDIEIFAGVKASKEKTGNHRINSGVNGLVSFCLYLYEDSDEDGLINIQEYAYKTRLYNSDTDEDELTDGDEINKYGTNPLKPDTDKDGLEDGDEIFFGTDPLKKDSDGNGIFDGDEKRSQTFVYKNEDSVIENVSISMEAAGRLQRTSRIENIMGYDVLCSDVVGLVGEPFSIESDSKFDNAVISFKIDRSKLGDTKFADLLFLWYDEENYWFLELETIFDEENSTVSTETTHFGKYMIVDKYTWLKAWGY